MLSKFNTFSLLNTLNNDVIHCIKKHYSSNIIKKFFHFLLKKKKKIFNITNQPTTTPYFCDVSKKIFKHNYQLSLTSKLKVLDKCVLTNSNIYIVEYGVLPKNYEKNWFGEPTNEPIYGYFMIIEVESKFKSFLMPGFSTIEKKITPISNQQLCFCLCYGELVIIDNNGKRVGYHMFMNNGDDLEIEENNEGEICVVQMVDICTMLDNGEVNEEPVLEYVPIQWLIYKK